MFTIVLYCCSALFVPLIIIGVMFLLSPNGQENDEGFTKE